MPPQPPMGAGTGVQCRQKAKDVKGVIKQIWHYVK